MNAVCHHRICYSTLEFGAMKSFTKASVKGMTPLIMAFDMAKSLHFYCDLLGFKLIQFAGPTDDGLCFHWPEA